MNFSVDPTDEDRALLTFQGAVIIRISSIVSESVAKTFEGVCDEVQS